MKFGLVLTFLLVITFTMAEGPNPSPSVPLPTTPAQEPYCCNKCPPVKVIIKPVVKTHVFKVNIPYPVFKALPTSTLSKCPEGFKKVSKRKCVHYVKSTSTCPPGYFRISDVSCLKVVVLPPKHPHFKVKCPKGYTKYGELGCQIGKSHHQKYPHLPKIVVPTMKPTKIEVPKPAKPLKCPEGFIKKGKYHCVKVVNCPKGYRKNKAGFCVREKVKCPKGFTRLGRKCIKSLTVCPRGYKYNKKEHACTKYRGHKIIYKNKCEAIKCGNPNCKDGYKVVQKPGACCPSCEKCKCSGSFKPVCGSNGVTYKNECTAKCLGATVKSEGACANTCPTAKHKCPYYYRPVCGEDGVTYNNRCSCEQAGVKVKTSGVCPKACK